MGITPVKALLFLVGGSAAAMTTAYVSGAFDTYFGAPPQVAALPAAPSSVPPRKQDRLAGEAAPAPSSVDSSPRPSSDNSAAAAPGAGAPTVKTPASGDAVVENPEGKAAVPGPARPPESTPAVTPSFDLVRVESDGSMVVAGRAGPRAKIDVVAGADVIGSAAASADGDFAIVLDKPLEPGDYQISLRATGPGEAVANSAATAIVSVPENAGGEVLAMVEEPGKPAELISIPEAPNPAPTGLPPAGEATQQSEAPPSDTPAAEAPAAATGQQQGKGSPSTAEPSLQSAATPSPVTGEAASVPPSVEPAAAAVAPATAGEQQPLPAPAQPAAAPAAGPAVMVEAVEIEGSMVFVAGSTEPGRRVRVYANSILLGDAVTSPQGRFLVEAVRDLPVGDYVIRVDVLEADGATVVARAAVPFEREPGETIAAVAPAPEIGIAGDTAAATQPTGEAPPANPPAPLAAAGVPAGAAPSLAKAAPSSATLAAPALPEAPAAGNVPERAAPSPETPSTPSMGLSAAAGAPADRALEPALHPTVAEAPPTASAGDSGALPGAAVMPAAPGVDIAAASPAATDAPAPAGALEVTAPKLQSVNGAVIIRRGDSLWRISRRVYGRGTRYSTIYLANQAQIRDPDRIWPGQVFKVPDRSKEGEAADMSGMGGQATTLPEHARRAAQR